jgi:hypothetical protein
LRRRFKTKRLPKRRYLLGEPRRRTTRYVWFRRNKKASILFFPTLFLRARPPGTQCSFYEGRGLNTTCERSQIKRWRVFCNALAKGVPKKANTPINKYSQVLKLFKPRKKGRFRGKRVLWKWMSVKKVKEYRYSIFFRRLVYNLSRLPFCRAARPDGDRRPNPFRSRRRQKRLA